jgi:hypothetical protein
LNLDLTMRLSLISPVRDTDNPFEVGRKTAANVDIDVQKSLCYNSKQLNIA